MENKPLNEMTIGQLIDSEEFKDELAWQIKRECEHHDELAQQAFTRKLRLQRAPIMNLRDRGVFEVENMTELFRRIICKKLNGFSANEREYIKNVCMMAYWRTVDGMKKKEKEEKEKQ